MSSTNTFKKIEEITLIELLDPNRTFSFALKTSTEKEVFADIIPFRVTAISGSLSDIIKIFVKKEGIETEVEITLDIPHNKQSKLNVEKDKLNFTDRNSIFYSYLLIKLSLVFDIDYVSLALIELA